MDGLTSSRAGRESRRDTGTQPRRRPSEDDAMEAVRTLISWAGDDPEREGLRETPRRVIKAYREFFSGYDERAEQILSRTFEDVGGYDGLVMLRDITFNSHCEHHMVPFIGKVHVCYHPHDKIAGISKLARVVEIYARRLQTQETMTAQIAGAIDKALSPLGVAVMIEAVHQCMSLRGIQKRNTVTVTTQFLGAFRTDSALQAQFANLVGAPPAKELYG